VIKTLLAYFFTHGVLLVLSFVWLTGTVPELIQVTQIPKRVFMEITAACFYRPDPLLVTQLTVSIEQAPKETPSCTLCS